MKFSFSKRDYWLIGTGLVVLFAIIAVAIVNGSRGSDVVRPDLSYSEEKRSSGAGVTGLRPGVNQSDSGNDPLGNLEGFEALYSMLFWIVPISMFLITVNVMASIFGRGGL